MGLFRRRAKGLTLDQLEAETDRAVATFQRGMQSGEEFCTAMLAHPAFPDQTLRLHEGPVSLVVLTTNALVIADPGSGQPHVEYDLSRLFKYQVRTSDNSLMLQLAGPDENLVQTCVLRPVNPADLPAALHAAALGGFVGQMVEMWEKVTGRSWVYEE